MQGKTAEIICVGTELLMGSTLNTNATEIAAALAGIGLNLYHSSVVGDNPARLAEAVKLALSRADIVITTGGLGPTYDDLTKETVAACMGKKLVLHPECLKEIEEYFARAHRKMAPTNEKQAWLPEGCTVLRNPNGTAPGCLMEADGKKVAVLPGPPREMRPMLQNELLPRLMQKGQRLVSHELHFYGIGESELEYKLHDLMAKSKNPTIAPYAGTGEVKLRVTASLPEGEDAEALLQPAIKKILAAAGDYCYGIDVPDLQTAAVQALRQKGLTVASAESCTGGLVAARLTEVPGASAVFGCGIVSYNNTVKAEVLGVDPAIIEQYTAVSAETAAAMAEAVRKKSGADIGIGVTGNAGPTTSEGQPVGLVFVAVSSEKYSHVSRLFIDRHDADARNLIRHFAALKALSLILRAAGYYKEYFLAGAGSWPWPAGQPAFGGLSGLRPLVPAAPERPAGPAPSSAQSITYRIIKS